MNWFLRAIKFAASIMPDPSLPVQQPQDLSMTPQDDTEPLSNPDYDIQQPDEQMPSKEQQPPTDIADIVGDDFLHERNIAPMDLPPPDPKTKLAGVTGHYRHKMFFETFAKLPNDVKNLARANFGKMVVNPSSVSLKPINASKKSKYPVFSAKIGYQYRALAVKVGGSYVWYWIGPHSDYDRRSELSPPEVTIPQQQMHA